VASAWAGSLSLGPVESWTYAGKVALDGTAKVAAVALALPAAALLRGPPPGRPAPRGRAAAAGLLVGAAFLPVMIGTTLLQGEVLRLLESPHRVQELVEEAIRGDPGTFAVVAFFALTAAPLSEELLFRGYLLGGLRTRLGRHPSAALAAAAFALVHGIPEAWAVTFLLGLVLADLRERTGGLTAPIAAHACYNAFQVAGIWAARGAGG
jgi:membrane protease YdiL (CAAX protease family)